MNRRNNDACKSTETKFLLCGAYGYTERLTAELAGPRDIDIVLAGRKSGSLPELGFPKPPV